MGLFAIIMAKTHDLPEYIRDLLNNIAKSEGFQLGHKIELKSGSNHGDNFLGVMVSATISGPRSVNGRVSSSDKLHLLCKLAPLNAARRTEFQTDTVFMREAFAYNTILPMLVAFQREKGLATDECFSAFPKCYVAIADNAKNQHVIIMEDLRPKEFVMWPKNIPLPAQHSYMVIEGLAKLHAVSFAMKDQRPAEYAKLKDLNDLMSQFFESGNWRNMIGASFKRAIDALDREDHRKILEDVKANMTQLFDDCLKGDGCEPFGAVGHGDCWSNNLLFRYNATNDNLEDVCFVDWQIMRYCSPALDLLYNIFTSTDGPFRKKEYQNLLRHYHQTLSGAITKLGSNPRKLFTLADLEYQMKKFGKYAFLMAPLLIGVMMADPKDIPDLDALSEELANDTENLELVRGFDEETQRKYEIRIRDLVADLVELGYYNWN